MVSNPTVKCLSISSMSRNNSKNMFEEQETDWTTFLRTRSIIVRESKQSLIDVFLYTWTILSWRKNYFFRSKKSRKTSRKSCTCFLVSFELFLRTPSPIAVNHFIFEQEKILDITRTFHRMSNQLIDHESFSFCTASIHHR